MVIVKRNLESYEKRKIICKEETRTKQSFKKECDINNILLKYQKTGQLPDLIKSNPKYGDFSEAPAYQEALNVVIHAQDQFMNLSAVVRERFNNNAAKFLEFVHNPKNSEELIRMGLATEKKPTEPVKDQAKVSKKERTDSVKESAAARGSEGPDA